LALVYRNGDAWATYYVEWLLHNQGDSFEVRINIILGKWGDGTLPSDRFLVSVAYRNSPKPGFMIIDPSDPEEYKPIADLFLSREQVLATPGIKEEDIRAAG